MIITTMLAPGTWKREVRRSGSGLRAVKRYWEGIYGKALLGRSTNKAIPVQLQEFDTVAEPDDPVSTSERRHPSMYDDVGSKVIVTRKPR